MYGVLGKCPSPCSLPLARFSSLFFAPRRTVKFEKDRRAIEPKGRSIRLIAFRSRTNVTIDDYDVESESGEDE